MKIDVERLRQDLMNCIGTAMHSGFPMAVIDLVNVETATLDDDTSIEVLVRLARDYGIDLDDYLV